MPTLGVLIASTRPGRIGLPVGEWIVSAAKEHGAFDVRVLDLAEIDLPLMNEPNHPRLRTYTLEHTLEWSRTIDEIDAFVFVMPEYNHSYTAPLKNALDYLHHEWQYKPVGLASYGGVAAGTRAVQALKPVLVGLKMTPLFEAVSIPFVAGFLDEDGRIEPNDVMRAAATAMFDELVRVDAALRPLRG